MHTLSCTILTICLSALAATVFAEPIGKPHPSPVSGRIEWVFDYAKGQELSKETGKPMFVVFRCER